MGILQIPNSASVRSARGFMGTMNWSLDHGTATLRFHERWCHLQPWLLAALAAWGLEAQRRGIEIAIENPASGKYAWRFGLAGYLAVDPGVLVAEHEEAGRFVALRTISSPEDHARVMADVVTLLHLSDQPEQAKAVQYVLSELVRNVREHSGTDYGAVVCAQNYPGERGRKYISVGVADTGVGVRATLGRKYDVPDDRAAVQLATKPGVSGAISGAYGSSNNAGAGLFFTRRLSESSDQYFALASGSAMFRTTTGMTPRTDDQLTFPIGAYPGTIACVNFGLEKEVDFDDFLAVTGRAFSGRDEGLRERIRSRLVIRR